MNTKYFLSIGAALMLAITSFAQDPGVYMLGRWNGANGTNAALAPATSATNTIATSEFNSAKLYVSAKGDGATTGNLIVKTYRSGDSTKYETATTTNLLALSGTTEQTAVFDLSETYLANCAVLRIVCENTNAATRSITNIVGRVRFNAPSLRIKSN